MRNSRVFKRETLGRTNVLFMAGDPTLVASTIFVPGVTEPLKGATITF